MFSWPSAPISISVPRMTALYLPPLQPEPAGFDSRLRIMVSDYGRPVVTMLPAADTIDPEHTDLEDRVLLALDRRLLGRGRQLPRQERCDVYLFGLAHAIRCGFRASVPPSPSYLESIVGEIVKHLREHYLVAVGGRGLSDSRFDKAKAYVENHLSEPIGVDDLADAVHLSPFHFTRMFRRSTGLSPHEYITRRRLERAKGLLATTEIPLAEIAARVGYRTQAHFTQVFHEGEGVTPRRYRQQQRAQP